MKLKRTITLKTTEASYFISPEEFNGAPLALILPDKTVRTFPRIRGLRTAKQARREAWLAAREHFVNEFKAAHGGIPPRALVMRRQGYWLYVTGGI